MQHTHYEIEPKQGFTVAHFLTVAEIDRAAAFYVDVLGGTKIVDGEPTIVQLANTWIILNIGGGPTDDKPTVVLHPPDNFDEASCFMNIRVADIDECYKLWSSRGAQFLTEPKRHPDEIRCYMRDPDGYLIEVGQTLPS
jgi:catechol 2,3-dioxygenase-like lactoylglutathione lyase family enzyme